MTIIWSPEAAGDLDEAVAYLVERNAAAARKVADAILGAVELLAAEPIDGSRHLLATGEEVRGWPVPPFRIYYQRMDEELRIVRVYHQARRPITNR